MKLYINGIGNISNNESFNNLQQNNNVFFTDNNLKYLKAIEPNYKEIINPMLLRRMSKAMKIGLATAITCLKDSAVNVPDAIITATGLGCVDDSEKFLISLIQNNEQTLNPTPFIQSTHNTIGSQIALYLKCYGYNCTYSGRGASFESVIIDAFFQFQSNNFKNILIGAYDELIDNQVKIIYRMGLFKNSSLLSGEGSTFFLLSQNKTENSYCVMHDVTVCNSDNYLDSVKNIIQKNGLSVYEINNVLVGFKGDSNNLFLQTKQFFNKSNFLQFKNICGEYLTNSAFALWLSANIIKTHTLPNNVLLENNNMQTNNILIINKVTNSQIAIMLVSKC